MILDPLICLVIFAVSITKYNKKKLNNNISRECDHYHKKDGLAKTKHI